MILLFLLRASTGDAQTAVSAACLLDKYAGYVEAQRQWQRELRELISAVEPRYADVALVYMSEQLLFIDERARAVEYLLNNDHDQLRTDRDLGAWLDLDPGTRDRIAAADAGYAEMLRLGDAVRLRPPHPDGDGLREAMRDEITHRPEYQNLLAAFLESVQETNRLRCR